MAIKQQFQHNSCLKKKKENLRHHSIVKSKVNCHVVQLLASYSHLYIKL